MESTKITKELNKMFDMVNEHFYEGKLEKPMLLIQSMGKKKFLGYCTVKKVWAEIEEERMYEIAIGSEFLNRSIYEILTTLIHETVHLYNMINGVKDCSGTQYHNKNFRDEAQRRGLIIGHDKRIGWSLSTLNDETKVWVDTLEINKEIFDYHRKVFTGIAKKSAKTYTYTCPTCGEKVISKNSELHITCTDCDIEFERKIK